MDTTDNTQQHNLNSKVSHFQMVFEAVLDLTWNKSDLYCAVVLPCVVLQKAQAFNVYNTPVYHTMAGGGATLLLFRIVHGALDLCILVHTLCCSTHIIKVTYCYHYKVRSTRSHFIHSPTTQAVKEFKDNRQIREQICANLFTKHL